MSYEERIRAERPGMSKSFAKLADFLLDSYIESAFMTASELAHALDLDAALAMVAKQFAGFKRKPVPAVVLPDEPEMATQRSAPAHG